MDQKEESAFRRKAHPKLQMLMNGDPNVNAERIDRQRERVLRSERFFQQRPYVEQVPLPPPRSLRIEKEALEKGPAGYAESRDPMGFEGALPDSVLDELDARVDDVPYDEMLEEAEPAAPGAAEENIAVNVFVAVRKTGDEVGDATAAAESFVGRYRGFAARPKAADADDSVKVTGWQGLLASARVPLSELGRITAYPDVDYVETAEPLKDPRPTFADAEDDGPEPVVHRIDDAALEPILYEGAPKVVIGIIDVGGFDFAHSDFLRDGKTRFHSIWDQGGALHAPPTSYDYGSLITNEMMNTAIDEEQNDPTSPTAWFLERQSQLSLGSHGTHVAAIVAGSHGVCPNAVLAAVLISPEVAVMTDRRLSFYDSTRIAHAADYLLSVGKELGLPVSINISLGTNGHAHDASSAVSRWIDNAIATPGRSVCVAAGNAGQEAPEKEGDTGWIMGRIHTAGKIAASGLSADLEWIVVGNGIKDVSENELEIWYGPQDRLDVRVRPPGMVWSEWVKPGQFIENRALSDGSRFSIYNCLYQQANGDNTISLYLSPDMSNDGSGVRPGLWTVRLRGQEIRDGRFHGWIERDDPRPVGPRGAQQDWNFPSFFSTSSNVDESSVSSLACGHRVISVANLDAQRERINISSSQGPTRDGRLKPDVAATGTDISAAKAFAGGVGQSEWTRMTGTSMASPFVAGVIGLMLSVQPGLTAAQIQGIIKRTAAPLPGADFSWQNTSGFGAINLNACVFEAQHVNDMHEL